MSLSEKQTSAIRAASHQVLDRCVEFLQQLTIYVLLALPILQVEQGYCSPEKTDAVTITEPLNVDNVCLGHRGTIWGTIKFFGIATHGATPQRGVNAVEHAAQFIVLAKQNITSVIQTRQEEKVIPAEARGASFTVTTMNGGTNTNSVPDTATITFDRRLVPGETLTSARQEIHDVLAQLRNEVGDSLRYEYQEQYATDPVWVSDDQEIVTLTREAIKHVVGRESGVVCSPGSDDQRFFVRAGIESTIVYGPGNIRNVHNKDESLDLEDLRKSIEVIAIVLCNFLGVDDES